MNRDIRIDIRLARHWKYRKLKRMIGVAPMEYLIIFWCSVAEQVPNGMLDRWSETDIEDAAGWEGETGLFCNALVDSGFLDKTENGYYPHDWRIHQPWVIGAEDRSEAARKAAKARWKKDSSEKQCGNDAGRMRGASEEQCGVQCGIDAPSPSPSPKPLPESKPNSTSSSSPLALLPVAEAEAMQPAEQTAKMMTLNDFRFFHQNAFGTNMPGGCNNMAADLCRTHTAETIRQAFETAAIQGKPSVAYVKGVLEGNGTPKKVTRLQTFADAARQRDEEEMRAFVSEMKAGGPIC